ncbi:hypothetical protein A3A71_02605 [Candidatus Berkelbacteria bacterium RIFCSPLOWO2_01_FULL_50_28]|uniref:50S ribosomal protein L22 n=1 Tax=Candidatus Berkelbacteria bacterium RIFCSPLOWO2_01_FULL_50_28 TaxID=1797471 RepID=A0A1F5EBX5_9BACT|nr:MAG: hypothetical protein A2807_02095 [Candidatus Berkelbacteria bacterium RIFCSPHIGHO2_01_FULL_50_36]OGD62269.1 MAG: hypothetical protein A3F39_01020 [Candidatus Berkelbacteria bacterium RIFCSPHIGHO2_12_FULL_50_11]OGD64912.1 MAG: hypothetical protein A3A71_02605 [Candidatus Berkelbacteria bacterium RIFCSPLOWO2_01_FULL_50_28]
MRVTVKLRYQRHSARKFQPLTRAFAGKNLAQAIDTTSTMKQDSAKMLNKLFKMAKSAATSKQLVEEKLQISELFATPGPKIKRMRPNAKGRSNRYEKHLAHLTVSVEEAKPQEEMKKVVAAKKKNSKEHSADAGETQPKENL